MNKERSRQLGMSFGKANNQLRKEIMFELVKLTKRDNCYRCKKMIINIDNFSIEHKKPWLNSENPRKLFFDLKNIAFSHTFCNYGSAIRVNKINYPEGYAWCPDCKQFKLLNDFPFSKKIRRTVLCTKCGTKRRLKWRKLTGRRYLS